MSINDAMTRKKGDFRTKASLNPGQKGTIKMYEQYGDDLFCVRYRYNRKLGVRIKTVELIVDVKKI
jgi:hypothetical protein